VSGAHGLSEAGFSAKTVLEIVSDLQVRQRSSLDGGLNTSATGVIANLNASVALELGQLWELGQEIYDAHDPDSATGIAADHNGALSGATRSLARKSRVTLELTLEPHTTVLAGSVVSVLGNSAARFELLSDAISLDVPVVREVPAEAQEFGALTAVANTITQIDSPASGWLSVTNPAAAVTGAGVETDELYRIRRVKDLASQGGSTADGVLADVRKLPGILEAQAIENDTDATIDTLPPHSFELIVLGADDDAIAKSIWSNKPAGIQSFGSETVTVLDSEGVARAVHFTRPTRVRINVNYHVDGDATYLPPGVQTAIVAAVTDKYEGPAYFGIGHDVYLVQLLAAGVRAQGVQNLTLDAARHPAVPADAVPAVANAVIAIGPRELAYFSDAVEDSSWVSS
jgi:uncharacterized phage protein gp47/JayE